MAAAGGIGMTGAFGAPIGGALFAVETMTTFFNMNSMWKAYVCSFICAAVDMIYTHVL